jgi:uncharacterized Zn-binding protein involved in type VI secretion
MARKEFATISSQKMGGQFMGHGFARVGDATDHGGRIITGSATFDVAGKKLAQVGDLTVCPKCKGTFPITTGTNSFVVDGREAAIHGSKTACGATVIASQGDTTWLPPDGASHTSAVAASTTSDVAATAPSICLECLIRAAESGASTVVRT